MGSIKIAIATLCTILICAGHSFAQDPHKFDGFGDVNCEDEMAHLDNLAVQLQTEPGTVGHIIVYGGRSGRRGEARARASRMKTYLVKNRGVDASRILVIDGGYRENLTVEIWMWPRSVGVPKASPTVQLKDVRFKKGKIKKREYYHCGEMY
jgi:hypothetical protein